ncbi:hypothetical protein [Lysinibacillus agricola]|uniref:hypothetical protein n=1 Tax=Lysinibacillus agricola TaxID=2590012 RepID=UPI003C256E6B
MTNVVLLPLPLRFRADKTMLLTLRWHCAFAQKTSAAAASLSRKKHLPPKALADSGRNYAEA